MCVDLERWLIWVLGSEDVLGRWRLVDGRVSFRSCFLVSLATYIGKGKDCWSFHNGLCKQVCSVINHLKLGVSSLTRNQTLKFDSSISSSIYHGVNPLYQEIILVSSCKTKQPQKTKRTISSIPKFTSLDFWIHKTVIFCSENVADDSLSFDWRWLDDAVHFDPGWLGYTGYYTTQYIGIIMI